MEQMRTGARYCYGWSLLYGVSVYGERDFNASGEVING
jgi:FMN reductase